MRLIFVTPRDESSASTSFWRVIDSLTLRICATSFASSTCLTSIFTGAAFFAGTFFATAFFATGLLFLTTFLPALTPFLGARITATIHPLF